MVRAKVAPNGTNRNVSMTEMLAPSLVAVSAAELENDTTVSYSFIRWREIPYEDSAPAYPESAVRPGGVAVDTCPFHFHPIRAVRSTLTTTARFPMTST